LPRICKVLASWKWVLGYTVLLFLTLTQTRRLLGWLAERNLSGLLGIFLALTGFLCLVFLLCRIHRVQGAFTPSTLLRLAGFLGLYLFCMFTSSSLTVDRIHFIEYGILGLLCFHAVSPEHRTERRVGYAMVAVFAIGVLDECVQGLLDGRYFDLRDIVIDLLAGLLPIVGLLLLPLRPAGHDQRVGPAPPAVPQTDMPRESLRAADVSALLLSLLLLAAVLWVDRPSWRLQPLYGQWERENRCGSLESLHIDKNGTILWNAAEGNARGIYRIRGNRLDGPLLDVEVLEAEGTGPCAWVAGERRHRYFRVHGDELVFTRERAFPFRRAGPPAYPHG
jgi:hypothetical protein